LFRHAKVFTTNLKFAPAANGIFSARVHFYTQGQGGTIMAKAKKLPSGSWRCLAYSHSEPVYEATGQPVLDGNGKQKQRRVYESFTAGSAKEAQYMAAQFQMDKGKTPAKKPAIHGDMTLTEAIDKYIDSRIPLERSPTTIQDYRCIQKCGFRDLMDMQLKDFDEEILQEAVNMESQRKSIKNGIRTISAKRLRNEWALIAAVLKKYRKELVCEVELPPIKERVPELLPAKTVIDIIRGTEIELAVLLAAWLSFSMSEVRGLTKSKSISGDCIRIAEVIVDVCGKPIRKDMAKNQYRNRTHHIPPYIMQLIHQVDGDILVPMSGHTLYRRWIRLLNDNGLPHMTFHDLRHLSASIMALLRIPDKYAQERGGWKSDRIMKRVYMQTLPDERRKVDAMIDNYFENIIKPEVGEIDQKKYQAWLVLFEKEDSEDSKNEFLLFMQHEKQHEPGK